MQRPYPGYFIVFEGGEGTGKSTQIRALETYLKSRGRACLVSWEPGGTPLGNKIREVLLDPNTGAMDVRCEALLYAATRAEHVAKVIRPALEAGTIVLCDRYWDASRAYQGAGRGLGFATVDRLNEWATQGLFPDRSFLFNLDPKAGLDRVRIRAQGQLDRLEQEGLDFHQKVRDAYLFATTLDPARYQVLDASQAPETLSEIIRGEVDKLLSST